MRPSAFRRACAHRVPISHEHQDSGLRDLTRKQNPRLTPHRVGRGVLLRSRRGQHRSTSMTQPTMMLSRVSRSPTLIDIRPIEHRRHLHPRDQLNVTTLRADERVRLSAHHNITHRAVRLRELIHPHSVCRWSAGKYTHDPIHPPQLRTHPPTPQRHQRRNHPCRARSHTSPLLRPLGACGTIPGWDCRRPHHGASSSGTATRTSSYLVAVFLSSVGLLGIPDGRLSQSGVRRSNPKE